MIMKKIKTSLGYALLEENDSLIFSGAEEAACRTALRHHKKNGGVGTDAFATYNSSSRDNSESLYQVTITRKIRGQRGRRIEGNAWVTVYH